MVLSLCLPDIFYLVIVSLLLFVFFLTLRKEIFIALILGIFIALGLILSEDNPKYGPLSYDLYKPFDAQLLVVETDYSDIKGENDTAVCKILNKDSHKVLVYFYGETLPEINDVVTVSGLRLRSPADSPPDYEYYNKYLKSKNIRYTAFVGEKYYKITDKNQGAFLAKHARAFNKFLNSKIQTTFKTPRTSAFLRGLLLGDKDGFSLEDYNAFKESGSVHIVSVSGFHVMLLLSIVRIFLKKLPKIPRDIITVLFLVFLILVTGCTPSVIRASVMVIIAIFSVYILRDSDSENALCLVAIFLIISNRYIIHNISFVLSFAATYGIVKCSSPLSSFTSFVPDFIRGPICATISAQLGVFPAMMLYFGSTSLYSVIPNLVISLVVPALFAATPLALITDFHILIKLCDIICEFLFDIVHAVARLPFNTVMVESTPFSLVLMTLTAYLSCTLLCKLHIQRKRTLLKGEN